MQTPFVPPGGKGGGVVRSAAAEGRADLRAALQGRAAAAHAPRGLLPVRAARHIAGRPLHTRRAERDRPPARDRL